MKTYMQKSADVSREWHQMDAKGQILGRMATEIAGKLIGKHKPTYTPHIDAGDYVVVINAQEIEVTGNKKEDKMYYAHSGFPGALKERNLAALMEQYPDRVIKNAVKNMLPKNKLRNERMKRLKVYAGSEHQHQSQLGGEAVPAEEKKE
jgi:large subunit ribosomal protein L13